MQQRLFPGDHARVASSMGNLAAMAHSRGDLDGAQQLYREALEMQARLFPAGHPDMLPTLNNFAVLLQTRKDDAGAEALLKEALEIQGRILPDNHAAAASMRSSLAALLQARGDVAGYRDCVEMLVNDYAAWEKAEPGLGHGAQADEWRNRLAEIDER
jgi:Tfp pilus assembly protein PilF